MYGMDFTLDTHDIQRLWIALLDARTSWKRDGDERKEWVESAEKMMKIFGDINFSTVPAHDFTATFHVTF